MTSKTKSAQGGVATVPPDMLAQIRLLGGQAAVHFQIDGDNLILRLIDPEQAWFWSTEWQKGEAEAEDDKRHGRSKVYFNDKEFLASFD